MTDVSIVIPTLRNASGMLGACLESLRSHVDVDSEVRVEGEFESRSFAENCNRGAREARGEYLLFLNDDCVAHEGFLEPLVAALEHPVLTGWRRAKRIGMAGSRLLYPDGRIQHAGVNFYAEQGTVLYGEHELEDLPSRDVRGVTAACVLVRRDEFLRLGGFDEGYSNGNEDCDIAMKYLDAGYRIRYVAESTLTHHESASGSARWEHTRENIVRFTEKWLDRPDLWKS